MSLILFLAVSAVVLALAYRWMGRALAAYFGIDDRRTTPAHLRRDGNDFEPARASWLLPQHFSAIAAAGPVVGPILAGSAFGWLPAWLWILFGAILIGGIHDLGTLLASVRHGARSIAEVVRRTMNRRSYLLFLGFIWISLIYVIIAFADVTAGTFVAAAAAGDGQAPGPAVATSSLLYLGLALAMGLSLRFLKLSEGKAKLIFLPLVVGAILVGPQLPFDLNAFWPTSRPQVTWDYLLLVYCFFASIAPVWLLLQPRGALGGYFLYTLIVVGVLGALIGGIRGKLDIALPAMSGGPWFPGEGGGAPALFPFLFITIACGACSGFHSIVASGTTSKQLARESDARPVAYGGMLLEAFFACLSLATVMILAKAGGKPDSLYANGVAQFFHHATFGFVPVELARQFGLLCFATFVFDTLDACTRLARYVICELLGWSGRSGAIKGTLLTLAVPALVVSLPPAVVNGQTLPLWRVFWNLFGTSNQLLAALALLAVTMWMRARRRAVWPTLLPTLFMLAMTLWSLGAMLRHSYGLSQKGALQTVQGVEFGVAALLLTLAVWLLVEAWLLRNAPPPAEWEEKPSAA